MKTLITRLSVLFAVTIILNSCGNKIQGDIVITNVNIIDVEGLEVQANKTIVIVDNKIKSISDYSEKDVIRAENIIDGSGKYVIPGLWDMHTHVFYTYPETGVPIANPGYLKNFNKIMVANGIVGFRDMYGVDEAMHIYKEKIASGEFFPQHFIYSNHLLDGVPPIWPMNLSVATPEEAVRIVDSLANTETDFIKVYSNLSLESFQAIGKRCKELNIDMVGHIPNAVTPTEAVNAGMKSSEHGYGFVEIMSPLNDSLRARGYRLGDRKLMLENQSDTLGTELFKLMKEKKHWIVPTTVMNNGVTKINTPGETPEEDNFKYVYKQELEHWKVYRSFVSEEIFDLRQRWNRRSEEIVGIMHKNGVGVLAGTDFACDNPYVYPGFGLHQELKNLVGCGLSNGEALKTATINPAKYLNATDSLGTVSVNKIADLVILNKNPLEDIENTINISAVISNGKYLDRKQLDTMLKEAEESIKAESK